MENPHAGSYVALHTFGAVIGIARVTEVLEPYTGWDLGSTREGGHFICELWADGAGMFDSHHRQQVLAERDAGSVEN